MMAVVSAAMLIAALPTVAHAESGLDALTRSAVSTAARSLVSTERQLPGWHYPYYTLGSVWAISGPTGWTSGYLPGALWTTYALTGDPWFRTHAAARQAPIGKSSIDASSTDIGIRYFYSYARGYELTHDDAYRKLALKAAAGEAARFNPIVGLVRSRNTTPACEVIIDEMMNLQVLYWGADHGGSVRWGAIAHEHALTAANYFVRPDGSVYHVLEFDPATGDLIRAKGGQGYSATSMWARGQAWAIHGFATAYRHTDDVVMLQTARLVADRYLADLPPDFVPYWDFRDPAIPYAPRDSSAAAIAASGLLDLAMTDPMPQNRERYLSAAKSTLASLESPAYLSTGTVASILMHGTLNYGSPQTVDSGQSFGDYFFLEALQRLRRIPAEGPALWIKAVRASSGKPKRVVGVDGTPSTTWTSKGKQWLEFDLGRPKTVHEFTLALRYGTSRSAGFKVSVSTDRRHWHWASSSRSSGQTSDAETYAFKPKRARYVRISFSGTSVSHTSAVSEVQLR